uniref:Small ribosomal subunit protein mS35 mitochondrial conserved domain-containing protein n=1 Tax=Dendroctonus ponderosae TaxID=77166 RepID=J3JTF0_DENPD|nr:unknown [Dendroctonus ponderosae]
MINLSKRLPFRGIEKQLTVAYSSAPKEQHDEFKALNLYKVKGAETPRRIPRKTPVFAPRTTQMAVDQDWGSVWPGPRSFHPASVPLPVRQGFTEKGAPIPDKYANAELMKIPNFLHLTPPVIKRQCEALKKFCTPWPAALDSAEKIQQHFPLEITSSDYCHSSPSIRDPMARIVTLRFKLSSLHLESRAKDKFLRLVGDKYVKDTDTVTIVTDRCPLRKQNLDYAMYLLTALYHESKKVEPWEELKSEADMETYIWENNASKQAVEKIFSVAAEQVPNIEQYSQAVTDYMNEGENDYTISKYGLSVRDLLNLPQPIN